MRKMSLASAPMEKHGTPDSVQPDATADLEANLVAFGLEAELVEYRRLSEKPPSCVGRVSDQVRRIYQDAYTPKFISIGPLHMDNKEILRSSSHRLKVAYLHNLIQRRSPDDVGEAGVRDAISKYRTGVRQHEDDARAFYAEPVDLGSEEFVDMLVLDGCFLLEHMLNHAMGREEPMLFSTLWAPSQLSADLILLENQVPFFVLRKLLELSPPCMDFEICRSDRQDFLRSLSVHLLLRVDDQELRGLRPYGGNEYYHLLHLYSCALTAARLVRPPAQSGWGRRVKRFLCLLPMVVLSLCRVEEEDEVKGEGMLVLPNLQSATELRELGFKFKKAPRRPRTSKLDVRLEDGDTLVIPTVTIDEFTALQLHNLGTLEQCTPELPDDCTCYCFFMDKLVASPATSLFWRGILKTNLRSQEAVVTYFNELCKGRKFEMEGNYLQSVFDEIMERTTHPMYCKVHRWMYTSLTTLRDNYFSPRGAPSRCLSQP